MKQLALITIFVLSCSLANAAEPYRYSLNIYGAELTSNHWEEFFNPFDELDFQGTYLAAVTLAHRVGRYRDKLSYELEGQVVRHFDEQDHWEINALGTLRWEPFPWDESLDTSIAFGLGPSWASEKPPTEVENEGDTEQLLVYWMIEFAFSLPGNKQWAFITRIHHRSEAYGVVADKGGSNALALGLKYRF